MTWFRCGMKKSDDHETVNALLNRSITEISSDITTLGNNALQGCVNLTSVNFPEVTSVGTYSFSNATNLHNVTLPKCVTLNGSAFNNSGLTTLILPKCTNIGPSAFAHSFLDNLTLGSDTMCVVNYTAFNDTPFDATGAGGTIYVPSDLVGTYEADTTWATILALNANNKIEAITT